MPRARLSAVRPVLPSRDVSEAIAYYERLGFTLRFADSPSRPDYAGVERDGVVLHLQSHDESSWEGVEKLSLRFVVDDVDALFEEWSDAGVFHDRTALRDTAWGTREFAFYDLDSNGVTFYRDLA